MAPTAALLIGAAITPEYLERIVPVRPEDVRVHPASALFKRMWGPGISAMTLGRHVFVDPVVLAGGGDRLATLLRHELVHARQWRQLGVGRFVLRYARQYLIARFGGASHRQAYMAIDLEVEAREASRI